MGTLASAPHNSWTRIRKQVLIQEHGERGKCPSKGHPSLGRALASVQINTNMQTSSKMDMKIIVKDEDAYEDGDVNREMTIYANMKMTMDMKMTMIQKVGLNYKIVS